MYSTTSWITSVSCSSNSIAAEDATNISLIFQWLRFVFLSPCPQRVLLSTIDIIFLLTLIVFAIKKLFSRFKNKQSNKFDINEPLIAKSIAIVETNIWFKISLLLTTFLASLAIVSSILAFTQHTQIPW